MSSVFLDQGKNIEASPIQQDLSKMSSSRNSIRENYGQPSKLVRPGLAVRDSAGSSIVSNRTNGGDRHDVVSFFIALMQSFSALIAVQMVKFLYRRCSQAKWLEPPEDEYGVIDGGATNLGVLLRRTDGLYTAEPLFLNPDLVGAVERLGVPVAFTMSSEIIYALLHQVGPLQTDLSLDPRGFVLPVVQSVKEIAIENSLVSRESYVCLCRHERLVLVWGETVPSILAHGTDVETKLLGLVWGSQINVPGRQSVAPYHQAPQMHSEHPSSHGRTRSSMFPISAPMTGPLPSEMSEKIGAIDRAIEVEEMGDKIYDPEKEGALSERKFLLIHAVTIGIAMVSQSAYSP